MENQELNQDMKSRRADHFYLFIVLSFAIVILSSCCSINNINQANKDAQKMETPPNIVGN
jgi:hypothetical protein